MKKKQTNKLNEEVSVFSEPEVAFGRTLRIGTSEELDEQTRIMQAGFSHEERLQHLLKLRSITHDENELNRTLIPGTKIQIRKQNENT